MWSAFIAVGSELLGTERLDTNSLWVAELLERYGVELRRKTVVGDDVDELARALADVIGRADLVIVSGGLGPTADDITREAAARVLGEPLVEDLSIVADLESKFRSLGRKMPTVNRRQAQVIRGATVLPNPRGTAPGLRLERDRSALFLLPGVPRELRGLAVDHLEPWLGEHHDGIGTERRVLKVSCLPESEVEERVAPAYDRFGRESVTLLSSPGEIRVELRARGTAIERREVLDRMASEVMALVGHPVFTTDGDETLEAVVGELLKDRQATVATAESCTGGLVAQRLTSVPGSSAYCLGAVVAYSNEVKAAVLGVSEEMLAEHGAVSEPVARQLAEGARRVLGADFGLGITGIAGPGGGTEEKPIGSVHFGLATPGEGLTDHFSARFPGDRERVRRFASQVALEMLRRRLLGLPAPRSLGYQGGRAGSVASPTERNER